MNYAASKAAPSTIERRNILNRRLGNTAVAAAISFALVLFLAMPRAAHADDRSKCQHAIEKAEARLDKAIHDNGEHSREAEDRRRDLNAEREKCWSAYHQWWNGKDHRWETEHNWGE
jgi:hypothetical protein